jgi:hypothetical protein
MKRFFRHHGLSLTLAVLFLLFWAGQAVSGWQVHNEDQSTHGRPDLRLGEYLWSGHFWQATAENWESEFLQMGAYVILTCFLYQKGSAESNDPDGPEDPEPRKKGFLARNSLSLAFLILFLFSFLIHALGGWSESNEERAEHGEPVENLREFLMGSEFWFQSFQNWQSEFLAVLSIVVLSIGLRQYRSPESKKVDDPNWKTGA